MPRALNRFEPGSKKPYKLSRSRLERFIECPCCFYLDRRLGIDRVSGPSFTLNSATDTLLKKEFDVHRANGTRHPLMEKYHVDAVPFWHENMEKWRDVLHGGVQYHHTPTNLLITGAVDDLWSTPAGELIVVDYKSTSTNGKITLDSSKWKEGYKRQMEIYQWLLRRNGFRISDTGYFVYVNADRKQDAFNGKLVFDEHLLPYAGNDDWVEEAVIEAHRCLCSTSIPPPAKDCEWCTYRQEIATLPEMHTRP